MEKEVDLDNLTEPSQICVEQEKHLREAQEIISIEGDPQLKNALKKPDEDGFDDLDDLDDMLDEFGPAKSNFAAPSSSETLPQLFEDESFEKQLQAGMAELFSNLDNSSDIATKFEKIFRGLGEATALGEESKAPITPPIINESNAKVGPTPVAQGGEKSFQDTIKKTMDRMVASEDQATAAAAASENDGDFLAEMLKAMRSSDKDSNGGSDEDFSKALLGMMEQLTNKEILYEPMKELNDKFPEWMEKHAKEVSKADLERYKEQQIYVSEIVNRFESSLYDDDSTTDKEYIVERMQKMQAVGSPPSDLVGDLAAAQEILGAPEDGCPMQ